ncbi:hypothetical protein ACFLVG_00340 [Chloroflexota bacterium]
MELEKRGKPTITVCTDRFELLARATIENSGMPPLPLAIVPHPIGGLKPEEVREKADLITEDIITRLIT